MTMMIAWVLGLQLVLGPCVDDCVAYCDECRVECREACHEQCASRACARRCERRCPQRCASCRRFCLRRLVCRAPAGGPLRSGGPPSPSRAAGSHDAPQDAKATRKRVSP